MTARSSIKMARTVLSVGALALAAVAFALPVGAKPKQTPRQVCEAQCTKGDAVCVENCVFWSTTMKKKATVSRAPRPVAGTGAPARPTHTHR